MSRRPFLRRLFPSTSLSVMVTGFWVLMSDSFTLGQILLGMLLGVVVGSTDAARLLIPLVHSTGDHSATEAARLLSGMPDSTPIAYSYLPAPHREREKVSALQRECRARG